MSSASMEKPTNGEAMERRGMGCIKCGSTDHRVEYTRDRNRIVNARIEWSRVRCRVCKTCGCRFFTREVIGLQ